MNTGGIGYWIHHIDSGQEHFTWWEPEEHHDHAAIRIGDRHVVHSCGECEVEVPMGSRTIAHRFYVMDTEALDFVLGTDFFVQHSRIKALTLQAPYLRYVAQAESPRHWSSQSIPRAT